MDEKVKTKIEDISLSWWKGGGTGLKLNPVRKKFLGPKTDIFAHGKALIFRNTKEINLDGYKTILHEVKNDVKRNSSVL